MKRTSILLFCILFFSVVHAEKNEKPISISPALYKKFKKTETLISNKSYQQAEQKLKTMLTSVKQGSYEQAIVLRSLSSVYALKEQYKKAAEALSRCLNLKVLPESQEQQGLQNLGQLYMATEQYAKAIKTIEPWVAKNPKKIDAQINALIANAYAQLKRYRKALPYIKKAIAAAKKPEESWYQLNLALYYELDNYSSAATLLKQLVRRYPDKKTYWSQLSSVYQQLKQYKKAVSIKRLAYKNGFIATEKELLELVNLYLYIGSPYKAAKLLKDEIDKKRISSSSKNWETLANAWTMAKEFDAAVNALERASKLNAKGSLYQQLGQIHVEQEKWQQAINALNKAISKGGLKQTGSTYILLGMSYYELNNIKQAKKSFLNAAKYSKNKKAAHQWLEYIKGTKS
ncbi:MAG: tetratricopeptide repeat protein [Methylococcaceae bacterium]|nr:tetratricopeptide repeat protein [Methylococcaceae bacterium]